MNKISINNKFKVLIGFLIFNWISVASALTFSEFRGLGNIHGGGVFSKANAVSADGRVIVGSSDSLFYTSEAFRYSTYSGMIALDEALRPISRPIGISADGNTIIGSKYRYTLSEGLVQLPFDLTAVATDISADGRVIVGYIAAITVDGVMNEAFRYTSSEGLVRLGAGVSYSPYGASAYGVSGDG